MKQKINYTNLYIFPAIVLAIHLVATYIIDLYHIFPGFDVPMHFFGGMSIAYSTYFALELMQKKKLLGQVHPVLLVFILVASAALAAVLWEFLEFAGDNILYHGSHFQPNIVDTMKDLFMGLAGGYVIAVIFILINKSSRRK